MDKKVKMTLVGMDGNAFAVLGAFSKNARRQGWSKEEIAAVTDEATSGDYNRLLVTIMDNIEEDEEDEDEDDDGYDGYPV